MYHLIILAIVIIVIIVIIVMLMNRHKHDHRGERRSSTLLLHKLWSDHVWWTREVALAFFLNTPNLAAARTRLLTNQQDIGNYFSSVYGTAVGAAVTQLLTEHINIAVTVMTALRDNGPESAEYKAAQAEWRANAIAISNTLRDVLHVDLTQHMLEHLQTTTDEILAIYNEDYTASVRRFDAVLNTISQFANILASKEVIRHSTAVTACS